MKSLAYLGAALACFSLPAVADTEGEFEAGVGVSTLGPTVSLGYHVSEKIVVRGLLSTGFSRQTTIEEDGITYDVDGALGGFGVLADYHPFEGGFFVSGGLISSNSGIDLEANVTNQQIGNLLGQTGVLTGQADFKNKVAPTLAVGYSIPLTEAFSIRTELGAMAIGGISLSATSPTIPQSEIDAELKEVEDSLSQANIWPYVSIMASYRF